MKPFWFATRLLFGTLILIAIGFVVPAAEAASPGRLRCELEVDPLGVDVPQPRLYWIVEGDARGERQTAYQVLVASSANKLAADQGDLWNSGRVESDETIHISYGGQPLTSSQQVFWKVRLWDKDGKSSEWSKPATWTMGILRDADWKAKWIVAPWQTESLLFRREF
jgi:alpha-L-rhamnosidase